MKTDSYISTGQMEDEAVRLLESGKLRRAERLLKKMLEKNPNCLPAHFHLARVYRRTKEYELALRHAHRTLRLNPKERNACLNMGLIYDFMGRNKLALTYYKRELSCYPDNVETMYNIGYLYYYSNRWLCASKYLRRCFEMGYLHNAEDMVDKLGICYQKLRDVKSYLDVYNRYLQIAPNAAWVAANLGHARLYAKDYKGAILSFLRAKKLGIKKSVDSELARARELFKKEGPYLHVRA